MQFIWDEQNTAHLAEHGVTPEIAEAVFCAEDAGFRPSPKGQGRIVCEGTWEGRLYRLLFTRVGDSPQDLYPISCFPIRKRRTP